eukprot:g48374.t1
MVDAQGPLLEPSIALPLPGTARKSQVMKNRRRSGETGNASCCRSTAGTSWWARCPGRERAIEMETSLLIVPALGIV